ncbi:Nucleoside-triphosphatase [Flavobacterium indicum GPTSA100-9 = DSM 17447]|jgi:XTP/dITP diphosphohydrolase|uniref:dITP/XTP pyrophosphatase n=1 Tax=Flavobacterium indicum (strain DSM 17447 / CIP 109464 / GPTSA100-9) TaxID=1094466 RepID=H8XTD4_FLAIG|nr:non-canonical purine NTP diphosphatase [Flavobacterium indicum]CCG52731.1 Nucleoside-triphosphatase [Flavobacterium indicum GPTSA100-9 = DSM 17447]
MKLVFASNNKNKIAEIQQLIGDKFEIVSLEDIGCTEDIPETAETIEGNAILKAQYVYDKYGLSCFADDTGLEIDALQGEPGVYSARYAGEQKNADDNMALVLQKLENKTNRSAQFKTVIALNFGSEHFLFEGIVKGTITPVKRGNEGFGYDPIFQPEGFDVTFAEMSMQQKATISHRGKAVEKLVNFLKRMM